MNIPKLLINELIKDLEGLAPHSLSMTKKALSFVSHLNKMEKVADIGCGPGYQSVTLWDITKAHVVAIDYREDYIAKFQHELIEQKLDNKISPMLLQTEDIPFNEEEFDMIWSEFLGGDIGYDQVLKKWGKFVKKDGYIVICAYCWNNNNMPKDVIEFFQSHNIDIDHYSARILQMNKYGFVPVSHFIMPEECWWNYFCPIDVNLDKILKKYPNNSEVHKFVKDINTEINLFEKYGDYYEYAFFIGKKNIF